MTDYQDEDIDIDDPSLAVKRELQYPLLCWNSGNIFDTQRTTLRGFRVLCEKGPLDDAFTNFIEDKPKVAGKDFMNIQRTTVKHANGTLAEYWIIERAGLLPITTTLVSIAETDSADKEALKNDEPFVRYGGAQGWRLQTGEGKTGSETYMQVPVFLHSMMGYLETPLNLVARGRITTDFGGIGVAHREMIRTAKRLMGYPNLPIYGLSWVIEPGEFHPVGTTQTKDVLGPRIRLPAGLTIEQVMGNAEIKDMDLYAKFIEARLSKPEERAMVRTYLPDLLKWSATYSRASAAPPRA